MFSAEVAVLHTVPKKIEELEVMIILPVCMHQA